MESEIGYKLSTCSFGHLSPFSLYAYSARPLFALYHLKENKEVRKNEITEVEEMVQTLRMEIGNVTTISRIHRILHHPPLQSRRK